MIGYIVLALFVLYVLVVFVLSRFFVPFLGSLEINQRIPKPLVAAAKQLEKDANSPYQYLVLATEYLLSTNHAHRFHTIIRLPLVFETRLSKLYSQRGFMHCTHFNILMKVLLLQSKYFTEDDIRARTTFLNFSIHQFLQVRIAGQWYSLDVWGHSLGVPLGKYAFGFR